MMTALVLVLIVSVALNFAQWKGALPFPDRYSFVQTCSSREALMRLVRYLEEEHGLRPKFRVDTPNSESPLVIRAIYPGGLILNWAAPEFLEKMGNPGGGLVIRVGTLLQSSLYDLLSVTNAAARFTRRAKIEGKPLPQIHVEKGMGGKITLVTTPLLVSGIIGFRLHVLHMGKTTRWHYDKEEDQTT